jgi:hypothetical protein
MSTVKIKIKSDHIKLVKQLSFTIQNDHLSTLDKDNEKPHPFGFEDLYTDMGLVIYGQPENFDPYADELITYSEEQKEYMDQLWLDMPLVLELRCVFGDLQEGLYKRKFNDPNWKFLG